MSTNVSGVDPQEASDHSVEPEDAIQSVPPPYYVPTAVPPPYYVPAAVPPPYYVSAEVAPTPARRPWYKRPLGIALFVAAGIALAAFTYFFLFPLAMFAALSEAPATEDQVVVLDPELEQTIPDPELEQSIPGPEQVVWMDYSIEDEISRISVDGLSWDISEGMLNIKSNSSPLPNYYESLAFALPKGSGVAAVEMNLIATGSQSDPGFKWGIGLYNWDEAEGIAVFCQSGGTMYLAHLRSGEPLPGGQSEFPCSLEMTMSLFVINDFVFFGPVGFDPQMYILGMGYTDLDTAGIFIGATERGQVLSVSTFGVWQ